MIISSSVDDFSGLKVNGLLVALAKLTVLSACDKQSSQLILLNCCGQEEESARSPQIKHWRPVSCAVLGLSTNSSPPPSASVSDGGNGEGQWAWQVDPVEIS